MKNKIIFFMVLIVLIVFVLLFILKSKPEEQQNISTNNNTYEENNVEQDNLVSNETEINNEVNQNALGSQENISVITEVSPTGFMGSSLYKVVLYSNKEVYLETYDGNGFEAQNLVSKELLAKNVESISPGVGEDHYGEVIVKGGTVVNNDTGWIIFE